MRLTLAALVSVLLLAAQTLAAPPQARVDRLARGVNIPHWFWLADKPSLERIDAYFTDEEAQRLYKAGFTHVRVPIDPLLFAPKGQKSTATDLAAGITLLNMINRLIDADLAIVIDVHPLGTKAEYLLADKSPDWAENLQKFWALLAPILTTTRSEYVFLELLNEPNGIKDQAEWPKVQEKLHAAVRFACPNQTIILTGDDWGGIDGLLRLKPVSDKNVIYSFHFYESHTFTHQSAAWGAPFWKFIKGLPYPSTPESVEPIAAKIDDPQAKNAALAYGKERWNKEKIAARIKQAADWAKEHDVAIYCGEFGVLKSNAPAESRIAWLADVTHACKQNNIGWAMWDYAGGFALAEGEPGKRVLNKLTLEALK